jgi:hypothetical protein
VGRSNRMPVGIERINARRKQPNDRITFIKPLKGPDEAFAQDFLERIAAICNPIMKKHSLSIMSLEEYEPNREFVGRNFNAGEVIQLVLKAPYTGHWLPFRYVQMVMMHELAHCKQMNHSKAFWVVRNSYAEELRELWGKGYTGEGLWSRGITLYSGQYHTDALDPGDVMPEHLCGGTYRSSRKRKRKVKPQLTHKEREARRIARKFGTNGAALGGNDAVRSVYEKRKTTAAKPRVAQSARGRELRAAAALARFETVKREEAKEEASIKDEDETESETESETQSEDEREGDAKEAIDINGKPMLGADGRGMVRVCEDEGEQDEGAQNEMSELQGLDFAKKERPPEEPSGLSSIPKMDRVPGKTNKTAAPNVKKGADAEKQFKKPEEPENAHQKATGRSCSVCSMENDVGASTCIACANVLDITRVKGVWLCQNDTCRGSSYINAGDCGVCGVCGTRKCSDGT